MLVCVFFHLFAHGTAGAARIGHSPRPLIPVARNFTQTLGRITPRDREAVSAETRCLKFEPMGHSCARTRHHQSSSSGKSANSVFAHNARATQYSRAASIDPRSRGVLDPRMRGADGRRLERRATALFTLNYPRNQPVTSFVYILPTISPASCGPVLSELRFMLRFKILASAVPLFLAAVFARGELVPGPQPCIAIGEGSVQ